MSPFFRCRAAKDNDEAIRTDPKSQVAYNDRGNEKAALNDYVGAIRDFDEAIRLVLTFALQYDNRGSAKQNLKDYEGAIEDYDEAIRLDPKWTSSLNKKSVVLSACPIETLRNAEQALKLAEQTLAIDANNAYSLNAKACAFALAGDFNAAVEWQRKAMQNAEWMEDDAVDGGKLGGERIAKWESGELWLLPK